MINSLLLILLLSFVKLLVEDSLLFILMSMEMISMMAFFILLMSNPEALSLTSCCITMLTIMISESVLGLSMFISLMRTSESEKMSSLSLNY
uniref:NADH-ubiquinone oxidoreductase chain 4L n=1 Tax=Myrsidea sp. ADS-2020 TaxID=2794901 RepID=A0A7T1HF29_9NEOP|nr:NADH dehydrogenase subunit 4L [Myrsidea sp. ADS-2020]